MTSETDRGSRPDLGRLLPRGRCQHLRSLFPVETKLPRCCHQFLHDDFACLPLRSDSPCGRVSTLTLTPITSSILGRFLRPTCICSRLVFACASSWRGD